MTQEDIFVHFDKQHYLTILLNQIKLFSIIGFRISIILVD